jgi:hypothetical protein
MRDVIVSEMAARMKFLATSRVAITIGHQRS